MRLRLAPPSNPRKALLEATDGEWRSAAEIADRAGVSRRTAIRTLAAYAEREGLEVKLDTWVDDRVRDRKKKLYRKPDMTESERAAMYNSIFMPKAVPIPVSVKPSVVHRLKR